MIEITVKKSLNVREFADLSGISAATVYRRIKIYEETNVPPLLPSFFKSGKVIKFDRELAQKWVEKQKVTIV